MANLNLKDRIAIAEKISNEQIAICSRPTFKGHIDTVLLRLLKKYNMTLQEYYQLGKYLEKAKP